MNDTIFPKTLDVVPIPPPPREERVRRNAAPPAPDQKPSRYTLPSALESNTVVGYRTRMPLTSEEGAEALRLLSMSRPSGFGTLNEVRERELFEEAALGVLSSRQSTNFRGFQQTTLGPESSAALVPILRRLKGLEAGVLEGAGYTHVVLSRPYRTPFTLLLTFVGHKPFLSLATVPMRALKKRFQHVDDIPTIGYLQHLHTGILADGMERAAVLASGGRRRAQVFMAPFCGQAQRDNQAALRELEAAVGLTPAQRRRGWYVALVAQVGAALLGEAIDIPAPLCRKLGANLLAFRSERIQPGVNQEKKAPAAYQSRQSMRVPDQLPVMAGRAAYNAFAHWTGSGRERAKELLLLERIDVLTPGGKERLRSVRRMLEAVTDKVSQRMPLWIDLPTGRAFTRNAKRGKKAFALAGQRIYIAGLSRSEIAEEGLDWDASVRAVGAAASRSALYCELTGCVGLPVDCDLLSGICLMAGPVNQNDIGKQFYGGADLLAHPYPSRDPTSLLVWTLKAKTIADPIGNEEQLQSVSRKGALVDLRPGPSDAVRYERDGAVVKMRAGDSQERAFGDQGNFVTAPDGAEIPGNRGSAWPDGLANAVIFRS